MELDDIVLSPETLPVIKAFSEQMPGGFFIYHADGNEEFILANSAMLEITGCGTYDEFLEYTSGSFRGLVHPDDLDAVEESISSQIAANSSKNDYVEYRVCAKDGSIRWIRDYGRYTEAAEYGAVFIVFVSDVTAEHGNIMLEYSRFGEALYAMTSEFSSFYYVDLDSDSFVVYKNEGSFSTVSAQYISPSLPYSTAIRFAIGGLVCSEDRERMLEFTTPEYLREALRNENSLSCRYRIADVSHGQTHFSMKIVRCSKETEGLRFVMGFECIDKLVKEEQERERSLRSESDAKTSFLFNMSHDIRTPMNAVLGYARLIEQNIDDKQKVLDYREKIERSGDYLLSIINNVLEMAKIESGKVEVESLYVNTGETISSIIEVYSSVIAGKQLKLSHSVNVEHPHIFGDPTKLREVFGNLLSNAVKYTPAGGTISILTDEIPSDSTDTVLIRTSVTDTGVGMSPEFIPHIFDTFSRERNTTSGKVIGTGLGMSIVKSLVELMGGSIHIKSELGKGSCFTVILPHKTADDSCRVSGSLTEETIDPARFAGRRVLLAEDNDLNAEITRTLLEDFGMEVEWAEDGDVCLNMLKNAPENYYSLILMDIQMPKMNGYDAAKAIRALQNTARSCTPILAMTANAFEEDRRQALLAGMNGHIAKPIDIKQLYNEIAAVL